MLPSFQAASIAGFVSQGICLARGLPTMRSKLGVAEPTYTIKHTACEGEECVQHVQFLCQYTHHRESWQTTKQNTTYDTSYACATQQVLRHNTDTD